MLKNLVIHDGIFNVYLNRRPALRGVNMFALVDYPALRQALAPLREQGLDIAVDDAGAGYASFQHVLELEAEIIKLDISLIRDIHRDRARQALAAALIRFGEVIGARVIAEGVENREELATLRLLGVAKVQGYFVGKPMPIEDALHFTLVDGSPPRA